MIKKEELLVSEVLEGMKNKTITRKMLEDLYGVSNRTISNRFTALQYEWSKSKVAHEYLGKPELKEEIESLPFVKLFDGSIIATKESIQLPSGNFTGEEFPIFHSKESAPVAKEEPVVEEPIIEEVVTEPVAITEEVEAIIVEESIPTTVKETKQPTIKASKPTKKETNIAANPFSALDDIFEQPKKGSTKVYHGVYIDKDISAVLDKVPHGRKSELINETLRIAFTERGYLG